MRRDEVSQWLLNRSHYFADMASGTNDAERKSLWDMAAAIYMRAAVRLMLEPCDEDMYHLKYDGDSNDKPDHP